MKTKYNWVSTVPKNRTLRSAIGRTLFCVFNIKSPRISALQIHVWIY